MLELFGKRRICCQVIRRQRLPICWRAIEIVDGLAVGRAKAAVQVRLTAIAYNFKRTLTILAATA